MCEGGDDGTGCHNVLREGPRVIDNDVTHVGQQKEHQREAELGSQDGRSAPPQFTVTKRNLIGSIHIQGIVSD